MSSAQAPQYARQFLNHPPQLANCLASITKVRQPPIADICRRQPVDARPQRCKVINRESSGGK